MRIDVEAIIRQMAPQATPSFVAALRQVLAGTSFDSPPRLACFLGQCAHETGGFRIFEESLSYTSVAAVRRAWPARAQSFSDDWIEAHLLRQPLELAEWAYGGRMGNTQRGDGFRYRGRGPGQVTGKDNYRRLGQKLGLQLVEQPELLATAEVGFRAIRILWEEMGLDAYADRLDVEAISRAINCGSLHARAEPNGLEDRKRWTRTALAAIEANRQAMPVPEAAVPLIVAKVTVAEPGMPARTRVEDAQKSWTVTWTIVGMLGAIVQFLHDMLGHALAWTAAVAELAPLKAALLGVGANVGAAGFTAGVFAAVLVIHQRIFRNGK